MPFIAIVLALAVALGGGASIAAEHTHPGDSLYPIKANVNDKVEAVFDSMLGVHVGGNADINANANAQAHANENANLGAGATSTAAGTVEQGNSDAAHMDAAGQVQVHTGTSVKGGVGGIKTDSQTGAQVGI